MCNPSVSVVNSAENLPNNVMKNFVQLASELSENIYKLTFNIAEFKNTNFNSSSKNNYSRNFTRSFQNQKKRYEIICWYNSRFGNKALKCVESCKLLNEFQSKSLN